MPLSKQREIAINLIISLVVAVSSASSSGAAFDPGRTINNADWFAYPRYQEAPATGIEWPAYDPFTPGREAIELVRASGFDAMRLVVDPVPFIVFKEKRRNQLYSILFDAIHFIQGLSVKVIVSLSPPNQHPVWGADALVAARDTEYFKRYAELVYDMARRLQQLDADTTAFELINEPRIECQGTEQERWQNMLGELVERARAGNPHIALVVSGGCISAPEGLLALDPKRLQDENLIYTFHYYEPFSFTHQGAPFVAAPVKYFDQIPYPASRRPLEDVLRHVEDIIEELVPDPAERTKQLEEARKNLEGYYAWRHDANLIEARVATIADWVARNSLPPERIFIGEFGVFRRSANGSGALCPDRAAWISSVRNAAEKLHFRWAFFNIAGNFGLLRDTKPPSFDPVMLGSLGLGPPVPCKTD